MDISKLKGHIPDTILTQLPDTILKFELNTVFRLSHFLAQVSHESGNFTLVQESLNYSSADRIASIFKHDVDANHDRVISAAELNKAKSLVKNPMALANFVYANQNGNGNEASGDGFKFRGRGYIQLTGRANYQAFSNAIGVDVVSNPDLVSTTYPLLSAGWFFHNHNLHKIADKGSNTAVVTEITKIINGGVIGLSERINKFTLYYKALTT